MSTDPSASTSISLSSHPHAQASQYTEAQANYSDSNLPPPPQTGLSIHLDPDPDAYTAPPFHTHDFYCKLEKQFPPPIAHSLMRATRALLVHRIGRVRRDGLDRKDLDNQAYLFKAAMSEARTEITMRTRKETASINTATSALRREVESLQVKMQEEIANLKHEVQMEVDNRHNEARADIKQQAIAIEDVLNRAIIGLGDVRAEIERVKWDNMRRTVTGLASFILFTIIFMELRPKPPPPPVPQPNFTPKPSMRSMGINIDEMSPDPEREGLENSEYVT
ncbi:hypothetical protein SISNIDRAFT_404911 [Sistotremastrum niveocremeum HHB9708]|uniref:DUF1640-domain-containing protein n=1 Tax=Sistotremastrum niveocremeum HHB9708 TaxID=1314777 RepID=A0A164ZR70_9AGAM|nr:hypothetical protein SISNIDRAFT_404911 [Sistotremastrum niveocremeum HHB9708]